MRRAPERREARAGVDGTAPAVGELDPRELRKGVKEVTGEGGVGLGVELVVALDLAAKVVNRVVAAPEDGPVLGQAVVVELIARVRDAFAPRPANALELLVGERLGDDLVVEHRHDVLARPSHERGKDVGGERHLGRGHRAVGDVHPHRVVDVLEPIDFGVLKDRDTE